MPVTVQVFDPAMCCSTGICGPSIEPHLVQFAADIEWLRSNGVAVERFNLAQQPKAFVEHAVARQALEADGESALPLVVVDGAVRSTGIYPSRTQLAEWARVNTVAPGSVTQGSGDLGTAAPSTSSGCCGQKASGDASKSSRCC